MAILLGLACTMELLIPFLGNTSNRRFHTFLDIMLKTIRINMGFTHIMNCFTIILALASIAMTNTCGVQRNTRWSSDLNPQMGSFVHSHPDRVVLTGGGRPCLPFMVVLYLYMVVLYLYI
ncbi:hypothetical protein ACFX2J_017696 [Malus domestica]